MVATKIEIMKQLIDLAEAKETILKLEEEIKILRSNTTHDDPELDATDSAHPAWWRGSDHTFHIMCDMVNKILDGKEPLGVSSEPWQKLRLRLYNLHKTLAEIPTKYS